MYGNNVGTTTATLFMSGGGNPWPYNVTVEQWDGTILD